ncbi:GntR family transcriptional regulator [Paracoccus alkanivorans]|uniref:GntR family transcriptional regulator n=1 Tax=Paracoccus alkanivorans TaxID=2116655 RepID=A0A3M0MJQ1_9RHOB|nr:GntR family transcriptional regulator [Paracoccus alkanivorans]RMC37293.1 GntR family transcriptional regulator [Paracoccus alkanivorans]
MTQPTGSGPKSAARKRPANRPGEAPVTARQRAYDGIRAGILKGAFPPGSFIEEAMACEATGVSRSPVREALNRLAAEGFLELHPRRGAMVRTLSAAELRDLHEVRQMIESQAIRLICRNRRPVPAQMSELCDTHEATSAGDLLACVEINRLFHQALVAAAGNTVLTQVFDSLQANLTRVAMLSLQLGIGKTRQIEQEHRALIAALQVFDETRAMEILAAHLKPMPRLMGSLSG